MLKTNGTLRRPWILLCRGGDCGQVCRGPPCAEADADRGPAATGICASCNLLDSKTRETPGVHASAIVRSFRTTCFRCNVRGTCGHWRRRLISERERRIGGRMRDRGRLQASGAIASCIPMSRFIRARSWAIGWWCMPERCWGEMVSATCAMAKTGRYEKFPQMGSLEIEDDVEIGANSTIDRGALDTTRIGRRHENR